jgi:hypothetical protein
VIEQRTPYYTSHEKDVWNGLLSNPSCQDECDIVQDRREGFNVAYSDFGVTTHTRIGFPVTSWMVDAMIRIPRLV